MYVVIVGSDMDDVYGPFPTFTAAEKWAEAECYGSLWFVRPLHVAK